MVELLDLSTELLELILLQLEEGPDMLSLATSCRRLQEVASQPRLWVRILARTPLVLAGSLDYQVNEPQIRQILTFLAKVADPDPLFAVMHDVICARFQASEVQLDGGCDTSLTVSCRSQPQPHSVTGLGLKLLARTARPWDGHSIHRLRVRDLHGPAVASLLREPLAQLEVTGGIDCRTEAEAGALAALLEGCTAWRVESLLLEGEEVPWGSLGRAAGRGRLGTVYTGREVLGRGRREDVREVWMSTEERWVVDGRQVRREEEEEGWQVLDELRRRQKHIAKRKKKLETEIERKIRRMG